MLAKEWLVAGCCMQQAGRGEKTTNHHISCEVLVGGLLLSLPQAHNERAAKRHVFSPQESTCNLQQANQLHNILRVVTRPHAGRSPMRSILCCTWFDRCLCFWVSLPHTVPQPPGHALSSPHVVPALVSRLSPDPNLTLCFTSCYTPI